MNNKHILPIILTFTLIALNVAETNAQPAWQWMRSIGGGIQGSNGQKDVLGDFTTDRWGNSYITGSFWYDVDIDTITLDVPLNILSQRAARNGYVSKLNCAGRVEWISHWKGAADAQSVGGIVADGDYLYAFGGLSSGSNYPAYIDDTLLINGGFNISRTYMVKYDVHTGEKLAIYQNLPPGNGPINEIGPDGNFYFPYRLEVDFPYQGQTIPAGVGIVKTDSAMNYIDHVEACSGGCGDFVGNVSHARISNLDFDGQGNIYVSATSDSSVHTFFGMQVDYGQDHKVGMIIKLDDNLNLQWFEQNYIIGTEQAGGIAYPLVGEKNIYARTLVKACYQTLDLCAIFQGDTVFTQFPNGVNSALGINNYNKETGVLNWAKRMDHNIFTTANGLLGAKSSAINHTKDTLFYTGYSGNLGGTYFWDNNTIVMPDYNIYTIRFDTLGNLLGYDTIPYDPNNGAEMNTFAMQLTSNSTMYLAGHHRYGIHFPDSSLYPLNGSGSNMRDIWIAQYGTDGPCFRCDSVRLDFTVEQYIGNTARVTANNTQYAEAGTWFWDFGHANQTSTEEFPSMTINYPDTGYYQVCLTAQNFCDSATACKQVYIGCPKPIVEGFAYTTGNNSIQIDSVGLLQYDSYEWSFGDSTTSNDSLPFHQYTNSGTYQICLTAENNCGTEQYCEMVQINCPAPEITEWNYALDTFSLSITDVQATNYDSLSWDFGDSSTSTEAYPQHSYAEEGQYQVCLYAHNECGSTFSCEEIDVIGTGILSLENGGSIRVYPNPTGGQLNIEASKLRGNYRLELISTDGRTVLEDRFTGNDQSIDLRELSSGFYFLRLYNRKAEYTVGVVKE